MELATNTVLQNRYLIVRLIGKGGMGAVYEAKDQRLGHPVALKQTIVTGPQLQQAFEREARILARLRHPALPVVSDYFSEPSGQFLVMQYIPGDDLHGLLKRQGHPFPVAQVLEWADQLLDALEYLHSHNPPIIHRDIKPSNIKLSPRGDVILLDFGLSKGGRTNNTRLTMSGASLYGFTPHYAPLEQIEGQGTDPRSDLYSLAVTLHHLLTGAVPATAFTRASAQVQKKPDPLRPANELNPQVPAAIADVLVEAMALNPTKRPSSASAMRAMLKISVPPATNPAPNVPLHNSQATTVAQSPNTPSHHTPSPAAPAQKKPQPANKISSQGPAPTFPPRKQLKIRFTFLKKSYILRALLILFFTLFMLCLIIPILLIIIIELLIAVIIFICIGLSYMIEKDNYILSDYRSIKFLMWSQNGKILRVAVDGLYFYDATTLDEKMFFSNNNFLPIWEIGSIAFSPDETTFALASDKTIKLWDVASGRAGATLSHSSLVTNVAFSPDGTTVAWGSDDKTIKLWDVASSTLRVALEGGYSKVERVAFSPTGAVLASAWYNTIKLWDMGSYRLLATIKGHSEAVNIIKEHSEAVNSIAFSPDGTILASASDDKTINLWHIPSGTLRVTLKGHSKEVKKVTFSPDGTILASVSDDKTIKLWNVASGTLRSTHSSHVERSFYQIGIAFSPDGATLAASAGHTIKLWDVATGTLRANLKGHTSPVSSVAFSPDGQTLASGSWDRTVCLWDVVR